VCKGAPESVLAQDVPDAVLDAAARFAAAGLRVLAVRDDQGPGMRFLGLIGIGDPVRAKAPGIARELGTAGIRLVLITGDHPATAAAVAQEVGIASAGEGVHHGGSGAPDPEAADRVRVFARVPPEQKLDIVAALQSRGHIVAMTGDGVNDAPALRRADIGVAMGGGTEVARQAADLVLLDDDLATLTVAVGEGRRIYDNIRRFLHYALAGGTAELLVMLVGPLVGLAVPLLPAQILWVNLLTHGVPGVALGAEPAEPGILRRPPRPANQSVLSDGLATAVLATGAILALVVLGVGVIAAQQDRPWQSMVFVVLGMGQLGIALAVRSRRRPGGERQPALAIAVASSAILQLAPVLVPPLRGLFGTAALSPADLAGCLAAASLPGLALAVGTRLGLPLNPVRGRR
jgi:P-type Ca2+ transporter type 2C